MDTTPALVCPECGEPAILRPPTTWLAAWGPRPPHSHFDGEPLCLIGEDYGSRRADPIPATDFPNPSSDAS